MNEKLNAIMPSLSQISLTVKSQFYEFFSYSTVRSATIKSIKVGVVYRFAQLLILGYIIVYILSFYSLIKFHIRIYVKNKKIRANL